MLIYSIVVTVLLILFTGLLVKAHRDWTEEVSALIRSIQQQRAEHTTIGAKYIELQGRCLKAENRVKRLGTEVRLLGGDLDKANAQLRDRKALQGIKFTANVPHIGWTKTEFKLGVGPCGKEVDTLEFRELDDRYIITQRCTDGERKTFEYFKSDVSGRIEKAYKVITTH